MTVVERQPPRQGFSRSLVGLVLGAVVPIFIFGAITASLIVTQKEAALTQQLAGVATGLSVATDRELLGQLKTMEVLGSSLMESDDLQQFNVLARRALKANPDWRNIGLIAPDTARIIAGAPAVPDSHTYSLSPPHVAQVVATRQPVIVGTFARARLSEGPIILLMTPVIRKDRVAYVLGVAMHPTALNDIFSAQGLPADWTGATVDSAMVLAGRSRDADKYVGTPATSSLQTQIRHQNAGLFTAATKDGTRVYTVFRRSERTGWSVVLGVPTTELEVPLHQLLAELIWAAIAATVLALVAAIYVGRNILTTRHRYESALLQRKQELQEALDRLKKMAANLPGVAFQFRRRKDGSYSIPYASDAIKSVHNTSPEEVRESADKALSVVHPDDLEPLRESIERSALNLSPWKQEYRVQWDGNAVHWLFAHALPQAEPDGSVLWHGFISDISAQKAIEAEARQSELKFQTILESAPDAIFITDPAGHYRYVNAAAARLLGYTREALMQMHITDITPADETTLTVQLLDRLRAGSFVRAELRLVHSNQTLVPVAFYGLQLPDGHVYGSCRDVSDRLRAQAELQSSREELADLYENAPCGYHSVDPHGVIQRINRTALNWLGYTREEVVGKLHLKDVLTEASQQIMQSNFARFLNSGSINDIELDFQRKDGSVFHGLVSATSILDASGNFLSSRSTTFDLTERFHAEDQLRIAEERFRLFFEKNSSVMLLIDPARGQIVNANQAAAVYYGYSLDTLMGMPVATINTLPSERVEAAIQAAETEVRKYFVFRHRLASGELRDVEVYSTPIETIEGTLLLSIIHDITERMRSEKKVHQLAFYDALTHLPNRSLLRDRLNQAMATSKRSRRHCALMFIDLDNFKPINDQYGHSAGDQLLIDVAARIQRCLREIDTVARFGGDEFVVMLSELDEDRPVSVTYALQVAEKMRTALAETYQVPLADESGVSRTIEHHCTASIGVTVFLGTDHSQDELQKQADAAMYLAKSRGRNQVAQADTRT